jgi:hypothetical protein
VGLFLLCGVTSLSSGKSVVTEPLQGPRVTRGGDRGAHTQAQRQTTTDCKSRNKAIGKAGKYRITLSMIELTKRIIVSIVVMMVKWYVSREIFIPTALAGIFLILFCCSYGAMGKKFILKDREARRAELFSERTARRGPRKFNQRACPVRKHWWRMMRRRRRTGERWVRRGKRRAIMIRNNGIVLRQREERMRERMKGVERVIRAFCQRRAKETKRNDREEAKNKLARERQKKKENDPENRKKGRDNGKETVMDEGTKKKDEREQDSEMEIQDKIQEEKQRKERVGAQTTPKRQRASVRVYKGTKSVDVGYSTDRYKRKPLEIKRDIDRKGKDNYDAPAWVMDIVQYFIGAGESVYDPFDQEGHSGEYWADKGNIVVEAKGDFIVDEDVPEHDVIVSSIPFGHARETFHRLRNFPRCAILAPLDVLTAGYWAESDIEVIIINKGRK